MLYNKNLSNLLHENHGIVHIKRFGLSALAVMTLSLGVYSVIQLYQFFAVDSTYASASAYSTTAPATAPASASAAASSMVLVIFPDNFSDETMQNLRQLS